MVDVNKFYLIQYLFKRTKNLKLIIIGCWVIATGWKLITALELDPSLQNQCLS